MSRFAPSLSRSGYPATTATARVADNLALYGHTPHADEPEYRPMPDDAALDGIAASLVQSITDPLADTALEPDIEHLLWALTDMFHRKAAFVGRLLDDNEVKQRDSQQQQDGSEVRSVELERLIEKSQLLIQKQGAFERLRDQAGLHFRDHTGSPWRPRSGSMVNRKAMTAAVIESRDHLNAKRRRETEIMLPDGPKVLFAGGLDCNDHTRIWEELDRVHQKYADMVLVHGGNDRGAEKIATCWASSRNVTCITYKPDWNRDQKAAPFKRNDRMLEIMPVGLVVFDGNGITDNLADKAKAFRIPVRDRRTPKPEASA